MMRLYLQGNSKPPEPSAPIVYKALITAGDLVDWDVSNPGVIVSSPADGKVNIRFENDEGGTARIPLTIKDNTDYRILFSVTAAEGRDGMRPIMRIFDGDTAILVELGIYAVGYVFTYPFTTLAGAKFLEFEGFKTDSNFLMENFKIEEVV